ncbi:hypothetical protein HME9304_02010 [Flagellimonas maritima]|uniref:Uncharacterized protein n=1 Tax=Flagellimonas maritima TaxID=1383885 RepID=A0A2Z4LTE9_9FLAO|nr:hypothetical protein [Allomuricauda aurantiaca]AWX45002.1 hypothetical protein HME9304_02010 [Allomuricauda aurantiaca]
MRNIVIFLFTLTFFGCLPKAPEYPYRSAADLKAEAQRISDNLEHYIKKWAKGEVPSKLPDSILPKGYDSERFKNIRLVKFEDIDPKDQWVSRMAHKINFKKLYGSFPDPHCTYLLAPIIYAPFGSFMKIEGDFPYCRFFSVQTSPPFDGAGYRYDKFAGNGEVAIVDSDIVPKANNSNPFKPNGNRLAKNRAYEVIYKMSLGNATELDPSHEPPYRGNGKLRHASAIQAQGPWGANKSEGHGRGPWDFGDVWIRYYGIDKDKFPDAGVELPKMYFELKTGEKFTVVADYEGFVQASEETMANRDIGNSDPAPYNGKDIGWDKQFGIFLQIASGASRALYKNSPSDKKYVRDLHKGITGRGADMPAPSSLEPHATGSNYHGYLTNGMSIKKGKIYVLTGKMPTFPDTRNGAKILKPAQCRYWSLTTYDAAFPFSKVKGLENTSIMDDEIILDDNRNYTLVYSRLEDRPKNATAENGITWIDYGNTATQAFTLRWVSVGPEWSFDKSPNELNLPWSKTTWSGSEFDKTIIGSNNQDGFLKEFHPLRHYMSKETFENIGTKLTKKRSVVWE